MEMPLSTHALAVCIMVSCASCTPRASVREELKVSSPDESVIAVKSAVSGYLRLCQEEASLAMKEALAILIQDPVSTNIAPWILSDDSRSLYHHGYMIGDEHTWFEIHFRVEDARLVVEKILEQRETIAGDAY